MPKYLKFVLAVAIEYILVLVTIIPFNYVKLHNPWWFVIPYTLVIIVGFMAFYFIFTKTKKNALPYFFGIAIVMCVVFILAGLTLIASFGASMLLLWRFLEILEGNTEEHIWKIFMVTGGFALGYDFIVKFIFPDFPYRFILILLLIVQLLLVVTYHLLNRKSKQGTSVLASSYGIVLGGAAIFGLLVAVIGPYIGWVLGWIFKGVGLAVFIVVEYFVKFLLLFSSDKEINIQQQAQQECDPDKMVNNTCPKQDFLQQQDYNSHFTLYIGILVLAVIAIAIYFFMRNKRLHLSKASLATDGPVINHLNSIPSEMFSGKGSRRVKAPKDPVRIQVFQLQKKLRKADKGRKVHETLSEWLDTLPIEHQDKQTIQTVYEKVRYGSENIKEDEFTKYKDAVEKTIDIVKDMNQEK